MPPPFSTLCPAGMTAIAPSCQKSLLEAFDGMRFQIPIGRVQSLPDAVEVRMPRNGCGTIQLLRLGGAAPANNIAAAVTIVRMNRLCNLCSPLFISKVRQDFRILS